MKKIWSLCLAVLVFPLLPLSAGMDMGAFAVPRGSVFEPDFEGFLNLDNQDQVVPGVEVDPVVVDADDEDEDEDEVMQPVGFEDARARMIALGEDAVRAAVNNFWPVAEGVVDGIGLAQVVPMRALAVEQHEGAGVAWLYQLVLEALRQIGSEQEPSVDYALFQARLGEVLDSVFED